MTFIHGFRVAAAAFYEATGRKLGDLGYFVADKEAFAQLYGEFDNSRGPVTPTTAYSAVEICDVIIMQENAVRVGSVNGRTDAVVAAGRKLVKANAERCGLMESPAEDMAWGELLRTLDALPEADK